MSQYRANLCHTTWTGPHTMFGLSVGLPSARRLARQRHLAAMPASMQASEEPMAEAPTVLAASGACQRSASMCTQRASISAVCGYSSLSIMFLLTESAISASDSGSAQVWQNVARFWRALPSSITSSDTSWNTSLGSVSSRGNRYFGTGRVRSCPANTQSSICSRTVSRSCNGMVAISFFGRTRWLPAGLVAATHPASSRTGGGRTWFDADSGRPYQHHPLWRFFGESGMVCGPDQAQFRFHTHRSGLVCRGFNPGKPTDVVRYGAHADQQDVSTASQAVQPCPRGGLS